MQKVHFHSPIHIVECLRTPIGIPNYSLRKYSATRLAAECIKAVVKQSKIKKSDIDQVILGNTVSAGLGQNFARQATLSAGLSEGTIAFSVNNVCGAGMQAVLLGCDAIEMKKSGIILAGGAESATKAPFLVDREAVITGKKGTHADSLVHDGLMCDMTNKRMGEIVEELIKKHKITRQKQDQYALESHRKAVLAQKNNEFDDEIIKVVGDRRKKIVKDDRPRNNLKISNLSKLPTAFRDKGAVTAGNASAPSDGAAIVLLASEEKLSRMKNSSMARVIGYVSLSVKPDKIFESPTECIEQCLKALSFKLGDIDLFEISEAFAAQVLLAEKKLKIPSGKVNVCGGDLALGHPLGAAGARIIVSLAHSLKRRGLKRGLACVTYGGGGSLAMVIETNGPQQ